MKAGQLDKRVTIQRRSGTLDAYGQPVAGWADVATVWANVRPIGTVERLRSMELRTSISHTIAVRYQPVLAHPVESGAWRILYAGRILAVTGSRDLEEAGRWIVFDCVEGPVDGA